MEESALEGLLEIAFLRFATFAPFRLGIDTPYHEKMIIPVADRYQDAALLAQILHHLTTIPIQDKSSRVSGAGS